MTKEIDISSEEYRVYTYANGAAFRIDSPDDLHVITDEDGTSHRVIDKAGDELRQDLLMRGEKDDDGTIVVDASHGCWTRFCIALRDAKVKHG